MHLLEGNNESCSATGRREGVGQKDEGWEMQGKETDTRMESDVMEWVDSKGKRNENREEEEKRAVTWSRRKGT